MAKRGSLNPGMRMEFLFARLSAQINRFAGGKAEIADFMRYLDQEPESNEYAGMDEVVRLMGARPKGN